MTTSPRCEVTTWAIPKRLRAQHNRSRIRRKRGKRGLCARVSNTNKIFWTYLDAGVKPAPTNVKYRAIILRDESLHPSPRNPHQRDHRSSGKTNDGIFLRRRDFHPGNAAGDGRGPRHVAGTRPPVSGAD